MNKPIYRGGYWPGFVVVSRAAPTIRYSAVFDSRKQANAALQGMMPALPRLLKVIEVCTFPKAKKP